jgi:SHS2 domain-containing protein
MSSFARYYCIVGGFEIIEHTADVGFRARGNTLEELFETATRALLEINGAHGSDGGRKVDIDVSARDVGGLLVQWLAEVLFELEAADGVVTGIEVRAVSDETARGTVVLRERGDHAHDGTHVKAITYHQLRVEPEGSGWVAEVYVDV